MKKQIVQLVSGLTGVGLALVSVMPVIAQEATTTGASIFFSPSTKTASYVSGDTNEFTIDLMVNTGGQPVVGVDAVVTFTATDLQFVSANNAGSSFTIPIVLAQGSGKQLVTGLIAPGSTTAVNSASAKVSTLTFKTLHTGSTTIGISQSESNVAHQTPSQGDILASNGGGTANITITSTQPQPTTAPTIVSINPTSGDKAVAQQVVVTGTNFGNYDATQSKVYIGTKLATIINWQSQPTEPGSLMDITIQVPAEPDLTSSSTRQIKVHRADGTEATYTGYTYNVGGNFNPGLVGSNPYISSVQPSYGNKDVARQVTISGGNFDEYDTSKSKVFVGLLEATVLDWNNKQILVQVPANSSLTAQATLTVRVLTASDTQASFVGYTYTMGTLPNNGPEDILWVGVVLIALGASWLAYRKMQVIEATTESTNIDWQ